MSYSAVLLFPNQLFKNIKPIINDKENYIYYLIEEPLFFSDKERIETFNGLKLLMHRASMKMYEDYLLKKGLTVNYIEYKKIKDLNKAISGSNHVIYYDVVDHLLQKRLDKLLKTSKKEYTILPSQSFICSEDDLDEFIESRSGYKRKYFQTDFYRWQRKRLDILLDEKGDFLGGKLSFDTDNRQGVPKKGFPELKYHTTKSNPFIEEARTYVKKTFPDYLGNVDNYGHISFSFNDAGAKLRNFLENRLIQFGNYEDAIDKENPFLYHSLMSAALNIGIITPNEVVEEALDYFYNNQKTIKINEIEGFIRQIIGWREYYRMVYIHLYDDLVGQNLLGHKRKLTDAWYSGETGIEPVDTNIKIAFDYGYLHHIIRLMVVGQFMLLCEIHPDEMYRWFMEFAIDSYDWVMVPNIYGMVGYNDGGGTTTKPYISSSNYVLKMSNFKSEKGPDAWDYIWRALYYRFIHKHEDILKGNPRTSRMVWHMNHMKKDELDELLEAADEFI
jgi:deoxyribodipyrimidine photolyase-related protein